MIDRARTPSPPSAMTRAAFLRRSLGLGGGLAFSGSLLAACAGRRR